MKSMIKKYIIDEAALTKENKFEKNISFDNIMSDFSGVELLYDWNENFLSGYQYVNGKLISTINNKPIQNRANARRGCVNNAYYINYYWETCNGPNVCHYTYLWSVEVPGETCSDGTPGTGPGGTPSGVVTEDPINSVPPNLGPENKFESIWTMPDCEIAFYAANPQFLNSARIARQGAIDTAARLFCAVGNEDDITANAFKHAYWSAILCFFEDETSAKAMTDIHECAPGEGDSRRRTMDLSNNSLGRHWFREFRMQDHSGNIGRLACYIAKRITAGGGVRLTADKTNIVHTNRDGFCGDAECAPKPGEEDF